MTTKRPVNKAFNCPTPLVWRKGPPPSPGWWPASTVRNHNMLRWWDGETWSFSTDQYASVRKAAAAAKIPCKFPEAIEWLPRPDSWPERSRT